jgi:hypothetical protein
VVTLADCCACASGSRKDAESQHANDAIRITAASRFISREEQRGAGRAQDVVELLQRERGSFVRELGVSEWMRGRGRVWL